jgi:hypothetical protein
LENQGASDGNGGDGKNDKVARFKYFFYHDLFLPNNSIVKDPHATHQPFQILANGANQFNSQASLLLVGVRRKYAFLVAPRLRINLIGVRKNRSFVWVLIPPD